MKVWVAKIKYPQAFNTYQQLHTNYNNVFCEIYINNKIKESAHYGPIRHPASSKELSFEK